MKKTLLLVATLANSFMLSGFAVAQSPAVTASNQIRRVKGHVLTSTYLPSIQIRFDGGLKYVGSQKFILYGNAQVEQYFFVEADKQRRIRRMYWVQFEGYLPNINATYDYPLTEAVHLRGQAYIVNIESIASVSAVLKQDSQSDAARAASFLERKGYRLSESIIYQRFVRVVDEAKRNEFIVAYIEEAGSDASLANEKARQEFSSRALKGFTIVK